jgi:type IX secretion system PorP/SprF family membrane protein
MRKFLGLAFFIFSAFPAREVQAQGMHFSQYYNAPLLLSPANTALMPENDYRAGVQYRNQWSQVPATFNTISAYADFKTLKGYDNTNWLGIGGAFFSDRAGTGDLALTTLQLSAAYHLQLGNYSMISVGLGIAYAQRSVNFSKFTFDNQWDGFSFNRQNPNGENFTFQKTSYADFSGGLNYAFFPNENVYLKIGLSMLHVNRPNESFYHMDNKIGMRPIANVDLLYKLNSGWIAEISGCYTQQKSASEILYGVQVSSNVTPQEARPNVLIFGLYHRLDDAIIPMAGFEWNNIKVLASVDITLSELSRATAGNGAFEISFIYQGLYGGRVENHSGYSCPRF